MAEFLFHIGGVNKNFCEGRNVTMLKDNKTYYIFRHRVGVPSHLDVCLADEKNGSNFIFQTKDAAQRCLEKEFRNGRAFHDQKYGYVKHYIQYFYN